MGMDKETFENQMKERAVSDVKLDLAVEKYAKMAEMYGMDVEKIKSIVPAETVAAELAKQDAIKLVIDSAKAKKPAAKRTAKKAAAAKEDAPAEEAAEKPAKKPAAKKTTKKAAENNPPPIKLYLI